MLLLKAKKEAHQCVDLQAVRLETLVRHPYLLSLYSSLLICVAPPGTCQATGGPVE